MIDWFVNDLSWDERGGVGCILGDICRRKWLIPCIASYLFLARVWLVFSIIFSFECV